jgi:hypothetical protein
MFYILKFKKHEDLFEEGETHRYGERDVISIMIILIYDIDK